METSKARTTHGPWHGINPQGALFTIFVPIPAAGVIPYFITQHWHQQAAFFGIEAGRWLGVAMIPIGVVLYIAGVTTLGRGGCGPLPPVNRIVTEGVYGWTRNPMYIGVLMIMTGQGLLFGSRGMLFYALGWFVVFHLFEVAFDEKVLAKGFPDYQPYIDRTPRWLPRRPRL